MGKRTFNDEQVRWMAARYLAGTSLSELARIVSREYRIETSRVVISRSLRRAGVTMRTPSERNAAYYQAAGVSPGARRRIRAIERELARIEKTVREAKALLEELGGLVGQQTLGRSDGSSS